MDRPTGIRIAIRSHSDRDSPTAAHAAAGDKSNTVPRARAESKWDDLALASCTKKWPVIKTEGKASNHKSQLRTSFAADE